MPGKKPKLTVKEAKLIQAKAKGMTNAEAYKAAGYSMPKTKEAAVVNASKVLGRPQVQEALQAALVKHGITLDTAIAPIGKALTATKVEIHGKDNEAFAEVVEDIDLQLKGSDRALKLMGISNSEGSTVNVNFINVAKDLKDEYGI